MEAIIYLALFLLVPTAAVVWFVTSLVLFVRTPKTDPKRRSRKGTAVTSGIIAVIAAGMVVLMAIMFVAMFLSAIGHM